MTLNGEMALILRYFLQNLVISGRIAYELSISTKIGDLE